MEAAQQRGQHADQGFAELAAQSEQPEWNFAKYLVDREGRLVKKFPAPTAPDDPEIIEAIEAEL